MRSMITLAFACLCTLATGAPQTLPAPPILTGYHFAEYDELVAVKDQKMCLVLLVAKSISDMRESTYALVKPFNSEIRRLVNPPLNRVTIREKTRAAYDADNLRETERKEGNVAVEYFGRVNLPAERAPRGQAGVYTTILVANEGSTHLVNRSTAAADLRDVLDALCVEKK